jgi:hypothetical protein
MKYTVSPDRVPAPGVKIDKWTVLSRAPDRINSQGHRTKFWNCVCDCGRKREVIDEGLRNGKSKSCGCNRRGYRAPQLHGMTNAPEYRHWAAMIQRCGNPKCRAYPDYGGRGIKVCEQWANSFPNFYADMGPRPSALHTIERIENSLGYEPGNVEWRTMKDQQRNKRDNYFLTVNGERKLGVEWAEQVGLKWSTIRSRIALGWTSEEAVLTPIQRQGSRPGSKVFS